MSTFMLGLWLKEEVEATELELEVSAGELQPSWLTGLPCTCA